MIQRTQKLEDNDKHANHSTNTGLGSWISTSRPSHTVWFELYFLSQFLSHVTHCRVVPAYCHTVEQVVIADWPTGPDRLSCQKCELAVIKLSHSWSRATGRFPRSATAPVQTEHLKEPRRHNKSCMENICQVGRATACLLLMLQRIWIRGMSEREWQITVWTFEVNCLWEREGGS